nr:proton-dependent oligopeptide transporter family [Tanacetum cinerariifolium]
SGKGYMACPTCNKDTPSVRVLSKTAYVGHKIFLKKPHKWRSSREFYGQTDNRDPLKEFGRDEILAQIKVVDILCNLELIYPPALFDIMIHLVIYLPLEALEGGPIRPWWMYPFERYMKKLKGYVRNKANPEDPPPPTCQFQVFRSVCKSIGLRSVIRFDAQELKKVKWYVLYNSPEIDMYRSQFKSLFPNKDMKEEFPNWFGSQNRQRYVDNDKDPEVSTTSEFFALACGPTWTPILINSCVVDGVRYVVHSRDERRITQNSGICSPGPDGEMYYGQLQEILEFKYLLFKVVLLRVKWGVIVVEDDPDIIHFDNSSDLPLSTSLNDLDIATLHIDGQSTKVDVPPDNIIDVVDEDDDITDDEDVIPYDLAKSDNEDLINVDDDGVDKVYSSDEED